VRRHWKSVARYNPAMSDATPAARPLPAYRHRPAILLFVILASTVFGLDLWLKAWSFAHVAGAPVLIDPNLDLSDPLAGVPDHPPIVLVPSILNLHLTTNPGAVFGVGKGRKWFFITMSVIAVCIIAVIFARSPARSRWLHVALALILAGAMGNLYDRARFGQVRDMLHLVPGIRLPFGWAWPGPGGGIHDLYPWIFNLADVALVSGVVLMMALLWAPKRAATPIRDKSQGA
jgi:lipoprotein signal peptidase